MRTIFVVIALVLIALTPFFIKVHTVCNEPDVCPEIKYESLFKARRDAKKSLSRSSKVLDFSLQYRFPNTLEVNILIKKPYYGIFDKQSGETLLLDKNGVFLEKGENKSLPTVIQEGTTPNLFTLEIVNGVYTMYGISRGEIINDSLIIEMPGDLRVLFPLTGDSNVLLGSLRLIYSEISKDELSGKYSQVDLRFHNPILR